MSAIDRAIDGNRQHQREHDHGPGKAPPAQGLFVLTCMDARVDPWRILGLGHGDAHVVRNAGGRVTDDVIRSLALSQHLLDTREVMVIHHTDCGLHTPDPEDLADRLQQACGDAPRLDPRGFSDEEGSIREDVAALTDSPYTHPDTAVRGFLYDVGTGALREID